MIKRCILCLMVILLCTTISAAQSKRRSLTKKSAVVIYQGEGPEQGMYKWGTFYLKINGEVKVFRWGGGTRFDKSIYNNPNAYKKGAEWRIIYSASRDFRDQFDLWSATFTGRVRK